MIFLSDGTHIISSMPLRLYSLWQRETLPPQQIKSDHPFSSLNLSHLLTIDMSGIVCIFPLNHRKIPIPVSSIHSTSRSSSRLSRSLSTPLQQHGQASNGSRDSGQSQRETHMRCLRYRNRNRTIQSESVIHSTMSLRRSEIALM